MGALTGERKEEKGKISWVGEREGSLDDYSNLIGRANRGS